jgi:PAS domain S-box-containing protein
LPRDETMNPNLTVHNDQADAESRIERLSVRVAQLEEENVQLEEVLRRNSRMFEALLSNGCDGITLTGPDRRIVRVIKGLTGIDAASLAGVSIESLAVPEDRQTIVDAYDRLLQGVCGKITIAIRVRRANGDVVVHKATLTDMLDDPNVHGIVWNYSAQPLSESRESNR